MTTSEINGWIAGWTLAPPLQELFYETNSPLSATLGTVPGCLELSSTGAAFSFNFQNDGNIDFRLSASGFRITFSNPNHDAVASVIMLDPGSLILEADAETIESILTQPGFEHSFDDAFYYSDEDEHRLGILVDTKSKPMRVVAVAGTGDRDSMCVRARGLLNQSAHSLIEPILSRMSDTEDLSAPSPREFIKSRIRAATSRIPYPWLSDTDDEPVWNLAQIYPLFRTFLDTASDTSAGLINNYLEMMDDDGTIPVAGGNIGQPILAAASYPLLAGMCAVFHKRYGRLPDDTGHTLSSLVKYLERFISARDEDQDPAVPDAIALQLLPCELISLRYLARATGRLADTAVQNVMQTGLAKLNDTHSAEENISAPFLELIGVKKQQTKSDSPALTAPAQIIESLSNDLNDQPAEWPCLTLLAADSYQSFDYRAYSEWITKTTEHAQQCWHQSVKIQRVGTTIDYRAVFLAFAGMLTAVEDQAKHAFNRSKLREQRVTTFIEQKKKWLLLFGSVMVLVLIVFLISVQMRQTMPTSVYETNLGMLLQHYKAEQYDDALNIIQEMSERKAGNYVNIRFIKGKILYKKGDFTAAAEEFAFCIKKRPENPAAYYNRALCYFRNGNYEEALTQFEQIEKRFRTIRPSIAAYANRAGKVIEETGMKESQTEGLKQKGEERGAPRRSG